MLYMASEALTSQVHWRAPVSALAPSKPPRCLTMNKNSETVSACARSSMCAYREQFLQRRSTRQQTLYILHALLRFFLVKFTAIAPSHCDLSRVFEYYY